MAMNGSGRGSGDDAASEAAAAAPAPTSPKNKVKFLCSHGGKILPRPADGHLKYVGGETRVVSFPRDISFSELLKKLSSTFEGDLVLKYQLAWQDLDSLVSVKSDEDLKHMLDEHDRHADDETPRLRAFLFPSVPTVIRTQQDTSSGIYAPEQWYIDAVNGVIRTSPRQSPGRATFTIPSPCSSSRSTTGSNPDFTWCREAGSARICRGKGQLQRIHKVHSSPSLYGLGDAARHSHLHQFGSHAPGPLELEEPSRGSTLEKLGPTFTVVRRGDIGKSHLNQGIVGSYYPAGGRVRGVDHW